MTTACDKHNLKYLGSSSNRNNYNKYFACYQCDMIFAYYRSARSGVMTLRWGYPSAFHILSTGAVTLPEKVSDNFFYRYLEENQMLKKFLWEPTIEEWTKTFKKGDYILVDEAYITEMQRKQLLEKYGTTPAYHWWEGMSL